LIPSCTYQCPYLQKKDRFIEVALFRLDPSIPPTIYGIYVEKRSEIPTLKDMLGKLSGVDPENIILLKVSSHKFDKEFSNNKHRVDDIFDTDYVYAYETKKKEDDYVRLLMFHKKSEEHSISHKMLFGTPLVICVKSTCTYRDLYKKVMDSMQFFLAETPPLDIEIATETDPDSSDDETNILVDPKYGAVFDLIYVDNNGWPKKNLKNDDQPLLLRDGATLSTSWNAENRKKFIKEGYDYDNFVQHSTMVRKNNSNPDNFTLEDCLNLFTTEEQLGKNDTWFCSSCKDHMQAFKKFDLWSAPTILIIHLKRFSYYGGIVREKLEQYIDFPMNLDLTGKVLSIDKEPVHYELYAVSNHYGSLGGGHYTAYCKHRDGTWYNYDDSSVSSCSPGSVNSKAAYVLFYKRKGFEFQQFNNEWDQKVKEEESDSMDDTEDNLLVEFMAGTYKDPEEEKKEESEDK